MTDSKNTSYAHVARRLIMFELVGAGYVILCGISVSKDTRSDAQTWVRDPPTVAGHISVRYPASCQGMFLSSTVGEFPEKEKNIRNQNLDSQKKKI